MPRRMRRKIVVIADHGRENEAIMRLGRIGFDNVVGYLDKGVEALETRPDRVRMTDRITAQALFEQLQLDGGPLVLDVRTAKEWNAAHIEGSLNLPLNHLAERIDDIPRDRPIVVHCRSGYRSSIAAGVLEQNDVPNVLDLVGGIDAWNASKLPTSDAAPTTDAPVNAG